MQQNIICSGALFYAVNTKRFLFLQRNDEKTRGLWGLVGGQNKYTESAFEGLKREIQEEVSPIKFGGGMVKEVTFDETILKNTQERFEGGTPNISGVIGTAVACEYLENLGMEFIESHSNELMDYFFEKSLNYPDVEIYGPKSINNRTPLVSFNLVGAHPHDVSAILASMGIAVRSGHHCAMPLHRHLEIPGSVRASFYIYNDFDDIDALFKGIEKAKKILKD